MSHSLQHSAATSTLEYNMLVLSLQKVSDSIIPLFAAYLVTILGTLTYAEAALFLEYHLLSTLYSRPIVLLIKHFPQRRSSFSNLYFLLSDLKATVKYFNMILPTVQIV